MIKMKSQQVVQLKWTTNGIRIKEETENLYRIIFSRGKIRAFKTTS